MKKLLFLLLLLYSPFLNSQCDDIDEIVVCAGIQTDVVLTNLTSNLLSVGTDPLVNPDDIFLVNSATNTIGIIPTYAEFSKQAFTYTTAQNTNPGCEVWYTALGRNRSLVTNSPLINNYSGNPIAQFTSCPGMVELDFLGFNCMTCDYNWTLDGVPHSVESSVTTYDENANSLIVFSDIQTEILTPGLHQLCIEVSHPDVDCTINPTDLYCIEFNIEDFMGGPTFNAVGYNGSICPGQDIYFQNTSTYDPAVGAYTWEVIDMMTGTTVYSTESFDFLYIFENSGMYSVQLTYSQDGVGMDCVSPTTEFAIVVDNDAPIEISCPSVVCSGSEVTYIALDGGACSGFMWSSTGPIVSAVDNGNGSYTVEWDNVNQYEVGSVVLESASCNTNYCFPSIVDVPIFPTATQITGPEQVCSAQSLMYSVPDIPGSFYSWSASVLKTDGTTVHLTFSETSSVLNLLFSTMPYGIITISVDISNPYADCDDITASIVVSYPEITGDLEICLGSKIDLSYSLPNPNGLNITYTVSNFSGTNVAGPFPLATTYTPQAAGIYYVDFSIGGTGCLQPIEVSVIELQPPTITGEFNICPGEVYTYNIPCASDETATWTIVGASSSNTPYINGCTVEVVWDSGASQYSLQVEKTRDLGNGNLCTVDSDVFSVSISDPQLSISGPQSVCYDALEAYSANDIGADYYDWSILPENIGSVVSGQGTKDIEIQWLYDPGTMSAEIKCKANICSTPIISTLNVDFEDYEMSISPNATVCENESILVSVFGTTDPLLSFSSITWTVNGVPYPQGNGLDEVSFIFETAGTKNISATVKNPNGCIQTINLSTTITVNPSPLPLFSQSFFGICPKSNVTNTDLTVTNVGAGATYAWTKNGTFLPNETSNTITLSTFDISLSTLIITVEVTDNGCTTIISQNFGWECGVPQNCCVADMQINSFSFSDCNTVTFDGDIVDLANQVASSWAIYHNYNSTIVVNPDFYIEIDNEFKLTQFDKPLISGPGMYTLVLQNQCGFSDSGLPCIQTEFENLLLPFEQDFTYDFICDGNNSYTLRLYDNSLYAEDHGVITSNINYTWNVTGETTVSGNDIRFVEFTGLTEGSQVVASLDLEGYGYGANECAPKTYTIDIPNLPDADFSIENDYSCIDQILTFSTVQDVDEIESVLWDFDDGSLSRKNPVDKIFNDPNNPNHPDYNVSLTVTDIYGCTATNTELLSITDNSITGSISYTMEGSCDAMAKLIFTPGGNETIVDYEWSVGGGTSTGAVPEIMITQSGVYMVTVTDDDGCTEVFTSADISLVDAFGSDLTVGSNKCGSKTIVFSVNTGYEYVIHFDIDMGASSGFTTDTEFDAAGDYIITVYVFNSGANTSDLSLACAVDDISFSVIPSPTVPILISGNLNCSTDAVLISFDDPSIYDLSQYTINWSGPGIVNATDIFDINVFTNGKYTATVTDRISNCSESSTIEVKNAAPDLSGMITGCYSTCEEGGLLDDGILTSPVDENIGNWSWNLDGSPITNYSGSSSYPISLVLDDVTFNLDQEHKITFVYEIDGCVFESEPFCLTVEDCTQAPCLVYADGQACGFDPIDCAVSESDGGPIYFISMDYLIPSGDDFDPPAPGVKLSYCEIEPFLVGNGTLYVNEEDIQQIGSDQLSVIGSFTVDNPSIWSGSNPLAVQINYCGDDGNIYCVQYEINPVYCPTDPLECNVWYVGSASAGPKDRDNYLAQYCVNLYNVNSNGCQSTDWTIEVEFEDINGITSPAYYETLSIAGQGTVVTHCFDVNIPVTMDLNNVPYLNFNITSNCPGIGCYHQFWHLGTENYSGNPKPLIGFPSNEIENVFTIDLPQEDFPDFEGGSLFFEGKEYNITKSHTGLNVIIKKSESNYPNSDLVGVIEYENSNKEINVIVAEIELRDTNHEIRQHKVFPNPFSGELNVNTEFTENTKIEVLDILGRKINFIQRTIDNSQVALTLEAKSGLYFINIYENKTLIASEKVIKL